MTTPPPVSTPNGVVLATAPPPFFRIPQELRDEIYDLAFACDNKIVSVKSLEDLFNRIRHGRRGHNHLPRQIYLNLQSRPVTNTLTSVNVPTCPLEGMTVCKQFFEEAAASWFRIHTLRCSNDARTLGVIIKSPTAKTHLAKLSYISGGSLPTMEIATAIKDFSSLREISILFGDQCFDTLKCKLCWVHDLQPRDFKEVAFPNAILGSSTIQQIRLEPKVSEMAVTEEEKKKWKQNVAAFEAFLNEKLKIRKQPRLVGDQKGIVTAPVAKAPPAPANTPSSAGLAESSSARGPAVLTTPRLATSSNTEQELTEEIHDSIRKTVQGLKDDVEISEEFLVPAKPIWRDLHVSDPILLCLIVATLICSISNGVVLWILMQKL